MKLIKKYLNAGNIIYTPQQYEAMTKWASENPTAANIATLPITMMPGVGSVVSIADAALHPTGTGFGWVAPALSVAGDLFSLGWLKNASAVEDAYRTLTKAKLLYKTLALAYNTAVDAEKAAASNVAKLEGRRAALEALTSRADLVKDANAKVLQAREAHKAADDARISAWGEYVSNPVFRDTQVNRYADTSVKLKEIPQSSWTYWRNGPRYEGVMQTAPTYNYANPNNMIDPKFDPWTGFNGFLTDYLVIKPSTWLGRTLEAEARNSLSKPVLSTALENKEREAQ